MEETVQLSDGKEVIVKEVKFKDMVANATEDKNVSAKFLLQSATGLTDEEYDNLTMKDGLTIQKAINRVNGLEEDFLQEASQEKNI